MDAETPKAATPTPEEAAHAQGYMKGSLDTYQDCMDVMDRLLKTIPKGMSLTQEGQANIALLKSLKAGFLEKYNATVSAIHLAKTVGKARTLQ